MIDFTRFEGLADDLYDLDNIAAEITAFTKDKTENVWRRLCLEMNRTGTNVVQETARFGVTPFVFDDRMIAFYNESDGFIYETLVESRRAARRDKFRNLVRFICDAVSSGGDPAQTTILMYGDSVGSDSILLRQLGFDVYYHDFDSYCADFARFRFKSRGLTVTKFDAAKHPKFNFIVCFEVAEHVPDPPALVRELSDLVRDDGVVIFSESFALLEDKYPTHLRTNLRYAGQTEALFQEAGMHLCDCDINEKPFYFTKDPARRYIPARRPSVVKRAAGRAWRELRQR